MNTLAIASDHAGFPMKQGLIAFLLNEGWQIKDLGPENTDSVDYPDYGIALAEAITAKKVDKAIAVCGTGIGMSITVNRFPAVRGALCGDIFSAKMSRLHNDSNLLVLGSRVIGQGLAEEIVRAWLLTEFEGGRHQRRLDKINQIADSPAYRGEV